MTFKIGDKVKCLDSSFTACELQQDEIYEVSSVSSGGKELRFESTGKSLWHIDRFVLVQPKQLSPAPAPTSLVPPKPGDKIICNNGEEFVCCTLETLNNFGITPTRVFKEGTIFGKGNNELASWMYWSGVEYPREFNWEIKEIIPAQQEVKQYVTEDTPAQGDNTVGAVFQEKTYTLQQIKEAFYILQWREDALETFISKLNEHQDSEYKLYLELKAKFEGKE